MTVSLIARGLIASRSLGSACDGGIASLSDGEMEGLWLKYTGQCNIISVGDMEAISERVCPCVCVLGGGGEERGDQKDWDVCSSFMACF